VTLPKSSRRLADRKGRLTVVATASNGASRHLTLAL
jgi:hypothetical protein